MKLHIDGHGAGVVGFKSSRVDRRQMFIYHKMTPTFRQMDGLFEYRTRPPYDTTPSMFFTLLQLRLCLSPLKNRLHPCRLHDVATDLQLARHEQLLRICLPGDKAAEVCIGEDEGDYERKFVSDTA